MTPVLKRKEPLEEALDKLDLDASLILANILIQKVIHLRNEELRKIRIDKLVKPDTAIKLPAS